MPLTGSEKALVLLIFVLVLARFVALDHSPPGFFFDEAALAAHATCLSIHGRDAYGQPWPLLTPALGGGYATPAFLYSSALLARIVNPTIGVLRLIPALFSALTILAVIALGHVWNGRTLALWSGLAAAASPWSFQFSRIFWDPPLAPCFLMWALFFWFRTRPRRVLDATLCGLLLSLAMYSYPPMRVQAPLVMLAAVLNNFKWIHTLAAASSAVVCSLPLILKTLSGEIEARVTGLSIFSDSYASQFGEPTIPLKLKLLLHSLWLHFNPWFLFVQGDGNLRHSTRRAGEWSVLDLAGVAVLGLLLIRRPQNHAENHFPRKAVGLCAWGYLCGVLPAAMTWEGTPHALRAIGAWPFLSLLAGFGISELLEMQPSRFAQNTCVILTLLFSAFFLSDYFLNYPKRAASAFDVSAVERLKDPRAPAPANYPDLSRKYFDLVYGHNDRCP